jgi:hypothetical protein
MSRTGNRRLLGRLGYMGTSIDPLTGPWLWNLIDPLPSVPTVGSVPGVSGSSTAAGLQAAGQVALQGTSVSPEELATLAEMGASDSTLMSVATGQSGLATVMGQLTGVAPAAGQPVTSTAYFPQDALPQDSPLDDALSPLYATADSGTVAAGSTALTWLAANWLWVLAGGIGLWYVGKKL